MRAGCGRAKLRVVLAAPLAALLAGCAAQHGPPAHPVGASISTAKAQPAATPRPRSTPAASKVAQPLPADPNALVVASRAPFYGAPAPGAPAITGIAAAAGRPGYYVLRANGTVDSYAVPNQGSVHGLPAGITATGIAVDARTGGYWVLASDGQVFAFDAPWEGDPRFPYGGWGQYPAAVAIAAPASGAGYYVLRANGAVDNYGVPAYGSLAGRLYYGATAPVTATGLAVDPVTGGYWEATSVGAVAAFHAPSLGSPQINGDGRYGGVPVSGIVATPAGGYATLQADGTVVAFPRSGLAAGAPARIATGATATGLALDPASDGYWVALDSAPLDGYLNPLRGLTSLVPQEIDQGVDYCGSGPIYAIGAGVVLNTTSNGWPGGAFISYRLESGPARGLIVYVAENVTPFVGVGETVGPTTVLGLLHDAGTCLETGWASQSHRHQAAARFEYTGSNSTAYGINFSALLQALGAEPGLPQGGPPGPLPAGWPSW